MMKALTCCCLCCGSKLLDDESIDLATAVFSFHVGSGCYDASAFSAAVVVARSVFDVATEIGFDMKLLDIGGGVPGQKSAKISFEEVLWPAVVRVLRYCGELSYVTCFDSSTVCIDIAL